MIRDKNKGIASIAYNHLNLPRLITFDNGNTITYLYDATGVKLQKTVTESGQPNKLTFYVGRIVYENNVRKFMSTEEGRIVLETSTPEYQYHMKDHLGNVRLTFTTASSAQQTSTYMATIEPEAMTLEAATFNNIETTRQEDKIFNHTPGGKASARLNAAEDRVMGPSMTLQSLSRCGGMMPGDTVRMKVQAKYFKKAKTKDPVTGMAGIVAASLSGGAVSEAPQIAQGIQETLGIGQAALASKDNTIPKAYINYLFFDKENNFKKGGYKQVSEAALGSFEELALDFAPEEEGTVMIYTANQTAEDLNVYMDDMMVMHTEGPIIRVDDYYPFGLTFNTSERTGYLTNKFLYNGKELQTDLDLDWYDYGARMYDVVVGRFFTQDRFAEKYYSLSPYGYAANNPIKYIDVNGDSLWIRINNKDRALYENGKLYNADGTAYSGKGLKKDGSLKGFLKSSVKALNELKSSSATGHGLVSDLQSSENNFIIRRGDNGFTADNPRLAAANLGELSSELSGVSKMGSGGTIRFRPGSKLGGVDINGNRARPAFVGLGHELFHASDANLGVLHLNSDFSNPMTGLNYSATIDGLSKTEISAVNQENQLRNEIGLPLRQHYGIDQGKPSGPRLVPFFLQQATYLYR